jgi:hypothetical protein
MKLDDLKRNRRTVLSRCYLRSPSKNSKTSIVFDPRTMYNLASEKGKFQLSKSETEAMLSLNSAVDEGEKVGFKRVVARSRLTVQQEMQARIHHVNF